MDRPDPVISAPFATAVETVAASSPMPTRTFPLDGPLDLRRTLAPLSRGPGDPTIRLSAGTRLASDADARRPGDRRPRPPTATTVQAEAWGPGADCALDGVPDLLGLDAEPGPIPSGHPLVGELARRYPGVRIPRTAAPSSTSLVPAILEQKVTGQAARRAWLGLIRAHGEPAPGPPELAPPARPGRRRSWPASPTTPTTRSGSSSAARTSSGGSRPGRPGSRRSSTSRSHDGLRAADGRARDRAVDRGRGRRPGAGRPGRGQRRRLPPAEPRRLRARPRAARHGRPDARAARAVPRASGRASSGSSS